MRRLRACALTERCTTTLVWLGIDPSACLLQIMTVPSRTTPGATNQAVSLGSRMQTKPTRLPFAPAFRERRVVALVSLGIGRAADRLSARARADEFRRGGNRSRSRRRSRRGRRRRTAATPTATAAPAAEAATVMAASRLPHVPSYLPALQPSYLDLPAFLPL